MTENNECQKYFKYLHSVPLTTTLTDCFNWKYVNIGQKTVIICHGVLNSDIYLDYFPAGFLFMSVWSNFCRKERLS